MAGFWRTSTVALVIIVALAGHSIAWARGDGWDDLAGPLRAVAAEAQAGKPVGAQAARSGVPVIGGRLLVQIWGREGRVPVQEIERLGGVVRHVVGRRADVLVPPRALRAIASLPEVAQVAPAVEAIPLQGFGPTVSEGVQLTNASAFYYNGIIGTDAKVAIIDIGFAGYDTAEIPLDPTNPAPVSYRADSSVTASAHGTAVAEVVADMAPGATIHMFAVDTSEAVVAALRDIERGDYNVCCIPIGLLEGPFDGTHEVSQEVDRARAAGVLVVVAAGNFAQRHWSGPFKDTNHDGACEFHGSDDMIDLTLPAGTFRAFLSWFETAGDETDQDYDLVLLDSTHHEIARSAYTQNGDDPPSEVLIATVPAGTYYLQVQAVDAIGADDFQLFVPDVDIEPALQVPETSLSIPADAAGALTVGASRGSTLDTTAFGIPMFPIDTLEPFSSRGPTVDGRTKPDLLGPDVVSTSVSGTGPTNKPLNPFIGTSAAAPHVAGAAALLFSEDEQRTAADLATALTQMAYQYWKQPILAGSPPADMSAGQDNNYGWGRLTLRVATGFDGVPPEITILYPGNGETVLTKVPTILASIQDNKTGVDPLSIVLKLDGLAQAGFTFDPTKGLLTYTVPTPLTQNVHSVSVQAADLAGNVSAPITHTFQVVPPSIPTGLQMVSLPYQNITNPDPGSIFIPPVAGSVRVARWVPSDTTTNKYHVYPDPWAGFNPPDATGTDPVVPSPPAGLGYFVTTPGVGTTLLNVQGQTVQDDRYEIRLLRGTVYPQGWNMIGNPYTSSLQWGAVEFITDGQRQDLTEAIQDGVTSGVIYEFKNDGQNGYYDFPSDPLAAVMHPFRGYWVHVSRDTRLVIYSPGVATSAAKTAKGKSWLPAGSWRLRLVASAGPWRDPTLFIGAAPGCSSGHDAGRDIPKPPPLVSPLQTYLPKSEWGKYNGAYAQDLRGKAEGESWDVEVVCRTPHTPVTVTWPDINSVVPQDVRLVMEDLDSGKSVYMRTGAGLAFDSGEGGVHHLRITALKPGSKVLQVSGVTAQAVRGRGAVITFSVSRPCKAAVQVRNISGRVVKQLAATEAMPGQVTRVEWNGLGESGAPVPPGRYLVCITARADDGQVVQGIRALQIGR
ncbi:MAG: S8 family serine peptidase [Armatimonadetes bacterium]|nr:S8 family serine peptidase [Armatimonadota bacterium]